MIFLEAVARTFTLANYSVRLLINEANEIVAMIVASIKTLRSRIKPNPKSKIQNP